MKQMHFVNGFETQTFETTLKQFTASCYDGYGYVL